MYEITKEQLITAYRERYRNKATLLYTYYEKLFNEVKISKFIVDFIIKDLSFKTVIFRMK